MEFKSLLSEKGQEALAAVRKVVDPLWKPGEEADWRPPDVDRRLTWALSKKIDEFVVTILAESENSWATRKAKELEKRFPEAIVWTTTGAAQSSYPGSKHAPHAVSREIRPGVSVGHPRSRAGTLGCVVNVEGSERDQVGFLTAAHVVALNKSMERGDRIYSPGKPEIGDALVSTDAIGKLEKYIDLVPIIDYQPDEEIFQSIDIAFVRFEGTDRKIPRWNDVPDPKDPADKTIRIKQSVPERDIPTFINQEVYKFGRTTGFTVGKLIYHNIAQREIKLPNNRLYLYRELFGVVATADGGKFSDPGDSGAAVYTADGGLLGFVVGADASVSLCCMAERSLAAMRASLVVGQRG